MVDPHYIRSGWFLYGTQSGKPIAGKFLADRKRPLKDVPFTT